MAAVNQFETSEKLGVQKILVVDDEPFVREALSDVLAASGRYETVTADDGAEALEKYLADDKISLIITDLNMPRLGGIGLIRKIRDAGMETPVIVMSGNSEIAVAMEAINAGANDYLVKNENIQEILVLTLDKTLEKKQMQEENRRLLAKIMKQQKIMEHELKVASEVQTAMLPSAGAFDEKPWKIHAFYKAALDVGGDFYDFIDYGEDKMAFFVADVSGHGPSAAMIAAMLKTLLLTEKADLPPPKEMMRRLNNKLITMVPMEHFVTAFFCVIDSAKEAMTFSRAGHTFPFLLRGGNGSLTELDTVGSVLGMFEDAEYEQGSEKFSNGDKLLMYSDGIFELYNSDMAFGYERLREFAKSIMDKNGAELVGSIVKEIDGFWDGETSRDDMVLIAVEYK